MFSCGALFKFDDNKYFLVARLYNGLICFVANLFAALLARAGPSIVLAALQR